MVFITAKRRGANGLLLGIIYMLLMLGVGSSVVGMIIAYFAGTYIGRKYPLFGWTRLSI